MKTNARNMLENDPRLTAYALGELAGDDAAAIEALLATSPAALAEVEAIRGAAASIRGALGDAATGLALSEAGRAAILESAAKTTASTRIIRHPLLRWGTTLTAAAASLALVATMWRAPSMSPNSSVLSNTVPYHSLTNEMTVLGSYANANVRQLQSGGAAALDAVKELRKSKDEFASAALVSGGSTSVALGVQPVDVWGRAAESLPRPMLPGVTPAGAKTESDTLALRLVPSTPSDGGSVPNSSTHYTFGVSSIGPAKDWAYGKEYYARRPARGQARQPVMGDIPNVDELYEGVDSAGGASVSRNFVGPSSGDTEEDMRLQALVRLHRGTEGSESVLITGDPKDIAAIQDLLDLLEKDADGDGIADRELSDAGRLEEAEQLTRLALEIDPDNEDLKNMQMSCMESAIQPERLEQRRAILERQRAEKVNELFQLAETRRRSGDFDGATIAVEQVRLIAPQDPSIETTLAQIQQEDRASRDNPFLESLCRPLSTFSIDVDTAAYSLVRQTLAAGQVPHPESVRIEELVNYFDYDYPPPTDDRPFAANLEIAACPWQPAHRLVRVGLKGQVVQAEQRPVANLVFLIDVSGSMNEPAKLPMVKDSLRMLVDQLFDDDRVALVVYAGAAGLVLPSTPAAQRDTILAAIDNLSAGGSTDGGSGITLAYDVAAQNFLTSGINRVVLATDGDFNVGTTDRGQLETLITDRAKTGVYLTTLGFGYGNTNDKTLETLADKGNGNYAIIDSLHEAKKVLVDNVGGTLQTIAKDVKIQVEFNPATVAGYRLIGYENRMLAARDFNDDTKDAGEIGAGHTVTALYEVVPVGHEVPPMSEAAYAKLPPEDSLRGVLSDEGVDPLKYQTPGEWMRTILPPVETQDADSSDDDSGRMHADDGVPPSAWHPAGGTDSIDDVELEAATLPMPEIMTLKLRYKLPDGDTSTKIEFAVADRDAPFAAASDDFRFAAAVAAYGMLLRDSVYSGEINMAGVAEIAGGALGIDESGRRSEFVELAKRAGELLASRTTN